MKADYKTRAINAERKLREVKKMVKGNKRLAVWMSKKKTLSDSWRNQWAARAVECGDILLYL